MMYKRTYNKVRQNTGLKQERAKDFLISSFFLLKLDNNFKLISSYL